MSARRVRFTCSQLARLIVFAVAALAASSAPARPLTASSLPPLAGGASEVIRPLYVENMLAWHTFLGGNGGDSSAGVALDASGNIYVAGSSGAEWQGSNLPIHGYSGGNDAYVAKLDPYGALIWTTFLGQSSNDAARDIAVDDLGNIFIIGDSDHTWQGTNSPQRAFTGSGGSFDVFVAKLSSSGELIWNAFLGSSDPDYASGIAVAGDGNVYAAGTSQSTWQGTTTPRRGHSLGQDAFVAKLDGSGTLLWNTFLGGDGCDELDSVKVKGNDAIYVSGDSDVAWQGSTSPLREYTASYDSYVASLDANGDLAWNTFLGGDGDDYARGITVADDGNVFTTGLSDAEWQGTTLPVRRYSAAQDAYVAKLTSAGNLTWNTFLGGSGYDAGVDLAANASGLYVAGRSTARWGLPVRPYASGTDVFAVKLSPDAGLMWNTFLGGSGQDYPQAAAIDGKGNLFIAGDTTASWDLPVRPYTSDFDGYIARVGSFDLDLPLLNK